MLIPVIEWNKVFSKRGGKIAVISLGVVLGLGGVGAGAYYLWPEPAPKPPPPIDASTPDENADYAASEDFSRLPMKKRLDWVERQMAKSTEMDDDEFVKFWRDMDREKRERIQDNMRDVMRERTKRDVNEFHTLPRDQRKAFIDHRIDEMEEWQGKFRRIRRYEEGRDRTDTRTPEERERDKAMREARMGAEMKNFMTKQPARRRAKTMAYFTAFGKRRTERGLSRVLKPRKKKK